MNYLVSTFYTFDGSFGQDDAAAYAHAANEIFGEFARTG